MCTTYIRINEWAPAITRFFLKFGPDMLDRILADFPTNAFTLPKITSV